MKYTLRVDKVGKNLSPEGAYSLTQDRGQQLALRK